MKIISFVGTRPEIIKNLAFCEAAKKFKNLDFSLIHTGQNSGPNMANSIIQELEISLLKQNSSVDRSTPGSISKSFLDFIMECIQKYSPDIIISNTDTDTAFYTAWAGAKLRVPVAHIEGGIRCKARHNPEEINRRLADHLSDWIFTISHEDTKSLLKEGFSKNKVFMLGDITLDALKIVMKRHQIKISSGEYNLLTIHRQENANNPARLNQIFRAVERAGFKTIFPIHPRTRDTLEKVGLLKDLSRSAVIQIKEPQSYVEMVRLLANCQKVISDSGGLRREAYMLDKPIISLVSFIWFKKMNQLGYEFITDSDEKKIRWAINNFNPTKPRPDLFGDGQASYRILKTLLKQI